VINSNVIIAFSAVGRAEVEQMAPANRRSNFRFGIHNSQPAQPMTGLIVE
jgi:hypothetical protein